ncbi:hypothetical protein B0H14DRAFT_2985696 [Mycena olivaceomarginata]|nr:hypothetical protein B0H14DRAFT_2985696 [Mycena olivaceomarginata]
MTTLTQRNHSDMARNICEEWYKIQDPCFDSGNFEAHWISISTKWDACYSQCQTGDFQSTHVYSRYGVDSVAIRAKLGCGLIFDLFWSEGDTPVEGWDRSTWSCCMLAVTDFEGCSNTAQLIAQNNVKSWKCGRMRQFLEKLLGTMTFENFFRQIFGEIGLAIFCNFLYLRLFFRREKGKRCQISLSDPLSTARVLGDGNLKEVKIIYRED